MKPTSIIFIFVSILLIVTGSFACIFATNAAEKDGYNLQGFTVDKNGEILTNVNISEENINKVSLNLSGCNVEVFTNSDSSYVELTNFLPNTYVCSVSGKTLTVSNKISAIDYLNLEGNGVKFGGVWQSYCAYKYKKSDAEQSVKIYLSQNTAITQFSINVNDCNLRLLDSTAECDIQIKSTESKLEFNNIQNAYMTFTGDTSTLSLYSCDLLKLTTEECTSSEVLSNNLVCDKITLDSEKTTYSFVSCDFVSINGEISEGTFSLTTQYDRNEYLREISAPDGSIIVNTVNIGNSDITSDTNTSFYGEIKLSIKKGSGTFVYGNTLHPIPTPTPTPEIAN